MLEPTQAPNGEYVDCSKETVASGRSPLMQMCKRVVHAVDNHVNHSKWGSNVRLVFGSSAFHSAPYH